MTINKDQTARNLAENFDEYGSGVDEMAWLYEYGFKGFKTMTDQEIETFIIEDCSCDVESFPDMIVYEKENRNA